MTQHTGATAALRAGWHPSPERDGFRQWYDGARWTDAFRPLQEEPIPRPYQPSYCRIDVSTGGHTGLEITAGISPAAIRVLLGPEPPVGQEIEVVRTAELVPEPDNPNDHRAVSVRIDGYVIGYLDAALAAAVQPDVIALVARGAVPTVAARIRAISRPARRGPELRSTIRLALAPRSLAEALPDNDPPIEAYTILPRGPRIPVVIAEDRADFLATYAGPAASANLLVPLVRGDTGERSRQPRVVVLLDGHGIGGLSAAASADLLPVVDEQRRRGLVTAAWATLAGSDPAPVLTLCVAAPDAIPDAWRWGSPVVVPTTPGHERLPIPAAYGGPVMVPPALIRDDPGRAP